MNLGLPPPEPAHIATDSQSALMKAEEGVTSLAEVNRVTKD